MTSEALRRDRHILLKRDGHTVAPGCRQGATGLTQQHGNLAALGRADPLSYPSQSEVLVGPDGCGTAASLAPRAPPARTLASARQGWLRPGHTGTSWSPFPHRAELASMLGKFGLVLR